MNLLHQIEFKFLRVVFLFHFFVAFNFSHAQSEEFIMLPDSEVVHLKYSFGWNSVQVHFLKMPENYLDYSISFYNVRHKCSSNSQLTSSYFNIDLKCKYLMTDTFIVTLYCHGLCDYQYPIELITLNNDKNEIKFGGDCYKLNCEPNNDPWMPTAYAPFLFKKNGYYLNPSNGKIKKGSRVIDSGFYTSCDLKEWIFINPVNIYVDKKGNKFSGYELIQNRKLNLDDWDLGVF